MKVYVEVYADGDARGIRWWRVTGYTHVYAGGGIAYVCGGPPHDILTT